METHRQIWHISRLLNISRVLLPVLIFLLAISGLVVFRFAIDDRKWENQFKDLDTSTIILYGGLLFFILLTLVAFYFLQKTNARSKKLSEQLQQNQAYYNTILNNIEEGLITTDKEGKIMYMNPAAEMITGWRNTDAKKNPLEEVYDVISESPGMHFEHIAKRILKNGKAVEFENNTLLYTKCRDQLVISNSGSPLFDAKGDLSGSVLVFNNITENKRTAEKLKESEEKYHNLIDQASDAILIYSFDGTIHEYNRSCHTLLGYTKVEFAALRLTDILVEDIIINQENYSAILAGETKTIYRNLKHKGGSFVEAEVTVRLMEDGNVIAFARDVTKRKKAESATRSAIERYDILARATSDTIWDWNIASNKMQYNDGITKMFGYKAAEVENVVTWWNDKLHPEDLKKISASLDDIFEKRLERFQLTYRFRSADGSYKYIFDRAFVLFDAAGNPIRMIGAMQDISSEKKQEIRIAEATINAQENERRQLGIELHDNINQILVSTMLNIGMIKKVTYEKAIEHAETSHMHLGTAIEELRRLSHRLAPAFVESVTIKEVFGTLLKNMNVGNRFIVTTHFDDLSRMQLNNNIQLNLYRILQEQLNNIIKYAKATAITISVTLENDNIRMSITDNGKGFDAKLSTDGIGINNMKKRTQLLAGSFTLNTSPGNGCEIIAEIPLDQDTKK